MAKTKVKKRAESSLLQRAVSSLASALTRIAHRGGGKKNPAQKRAPAPQASGNGKARSSRPTTDIPIDIIERTYIPTQTSMKAGFRSTGADHLTDQEFAEGYADDERFKDEDRYTNKSGDPRIGTHGRAYEPGEKQR